jgi:hypothetical protein
MKRTTLFLDEQLEHDLRLLSKRKGVPLASVVREAMAQYVANEKERRSPSIRFVASGRSGHADTAERHEDLLWGDLDPHGRTGVSRRARAKPPLRASRSRSKGR